jgi:hypothetical protein
MIGFGHGFDIALATGKSLNQYATINFDLSGALCRGRNPPLGG